MEDGGTGLSCFARSGGAAGRGKKGPVRRCGKPSEAKPVAGQTCQIEDALGALRERRQKKE